MPNDQIQIPPNNGEVTVPQVQAPSVSKWHGFKVILIRAANAFLRYTGISLISRLAQNVFRSRSQESQSIYWADKNAPWGRELKGAPISSPSLFVFELLQSEGFANHGEVHATKLCQIDGISTSLPGIVVADFNRGWKVKDDPVKHNKGPSGSVMIMFNYIKGKVDKLTNEMDDRQKEMLVGEIMTAMSQVYGAGTHSKLKNQFPGHMSGENAAKEKYFDIKDENDLLVVTVFNPVVLTNENTGEMKFIDTYRTFTVDREGVITPTSMRFEEVNS